MPVIISAIVYELHSEKNILIMLSISYSLIQFKPGKFVFLKKTHL